MDILPNPSGIIDNTDTIIDDRSQTDSVKSFELLQKELPTSYDVFAHHVAGFDY